MTWGSIVPVIIRVESYNKRDTDSYRGFVTAKVLTRVPYILWLSLYAHGPGRLSRIFSRRIVSWSRLHPYGRSKENE